MIKKKPSERYRRKVQVLLDDATYLWVLEKGGKRGMSDLIRKCVEKEMESDADDHQGDHILGTLP